MPPAEPALPALSNPLLRYVLATRPAFLSITAVGVLIGIAAAAAATASDRLSLPLAMLTLAFALCAHAAINVLNDYYDELNGSDRANTERIYPYTGGSRFIQNGVLTREGTHTYGIALMLAVVVGGVGLAGAAGSGLLLIGAAGLAIGWAYSAPPLKLNSRGWGEAGVAAGFALVVVGAAYVQQGAFSALPLSASVSWALLVAAILYINQFPDRRADAAAGKHHWVVRLGPERARWGYAALISAAYAWLGWAVAAGGLPEAALAALFSAPLSVQALRGLLRHAAEPARLAPAIRLTIAAATLHGLLLAGGLWFSAGSFAP